MSPLYRLSSKEGTYHYRRAFVYATTAVLQRTAIVIILYYLKRVLNKFCNKESKELRMSCAVNISKLHRILIDFKLSDKSLIDSLASSKIPFASLGGLIFS